MKRGAVYSVLYGDYSWAAYEGDAIKFLESLPDDSVDLLFTSPPYEDARSYHLPGKMPRGEEWVAWMVKVVAAAAPKVKGLIAVNCEGRTRGYRYSCVPLLLAADLHRAGYNLRKPMAYHRNGTFGGGGTDWLRNDWEPIVCVTRPGKLPWANPLACGRPPKCKPGGPPSHRKANGERVKARAYRPPALANPGNVISVGAVGGGNLGHPLAHENEAPFPLRLAEFLALSFCPPGGVVCDPFMGSSTTGHACLIHGRRFIGCDVRVSQVELSKRRLRSVAESMMVDSATSGTVNHAK